MFPSSSFNSYQHFTKPVLSVPSPFMFVCLVFSKKIPDIMSYDVFHEVYTSRTQYKFYKITSLLNVGLFVLGGEIC